MEAKAHLTNIRISPRKVKIVLDLIRDKDAEYAMGIIKNTRKAACEHIEKLLASAVANAENNNNMNKDSLYVSECFVTKGKNTLKRLNPRARGSADRILKRNSHITLILKERE